MRQRLPTGVPFAPTISTSAGRMSPLDTELAVMISLSGFRDATALKFPLVPREPIPRAVNVPPDFMESCVQPPAELASWLGSRC